MQVYLSNIELFYSVFESGSSTVLIKDTDNHHLVNVMRHKQGDVIHITNGNGLIVKGELITVDKKASEVSIQSVYEYSNELSDITIAIAYLKSGDRQEFALEKCIELGFTNFVFYKGDKSIPTKTNLERLNKIAISGMKQSLRAFLPKIKCLKNIAEVIKENKEVIYLDQSAIESVNSVTISGEKCFVFGPEGGFSDKEFEILKKHKGYKLTQNRLRSETAIITTAAILSTKN